MALTYGLAAYLGRLTIVDGGTTSLVWPAAGVAAVWLLRAPAERRSSSLAALSVASVLVYRITGADWATSLDRTAGALVQLLVLLAWVRAHQRPQDGGTGPRMRSVADLGVLTAAAAVAALANAAVGAVQLLAEGDFDWPSCANLWTRNAAGIVGVGLPCLVLASAAARHGGWRRLTARLTVREPGLQAGGLALGVAALTVLVHGAVFWWFSGSPLGYGLLLPSIAAGLALRPAGAALHGLVSATATVVFTLAGQGPFVPALAGEGYAPIAQLCAMLIVVTGLSLSFLRAESRRLQQRLAERARSTQVRLEEVSTIVENVHDGLVLLKQDGSVLLTNPAADRLVGRPIAPDGKILPVTEYRSFHLDGRPLAEDERPSAIALRTGEVAIGVVVQRAEGSREHVLRVVATPMDGPADDPQRRVVVVMSDVTAEHEERRALQSFAGVVAHDLLNPIGVVEGWAEALQEALDTDGVVDAATAGPMVARVRRSARSMQGFVEDLLGFTTARDQALRPQDVDLAALVDELASFRQDGAREERRPVIEVGVLPVVHGDPLLVRQLLDNLLGNAVKYVAPGTTPRLSVDSRPGRTGFVEVRVTDNGIGIPVAERARVFDEFHRLQREGYAGTGLGLAICHRIVERHGGRIWVEDAPDGQGTRFALDLPLTASALASGVG